MFPVLTYRTISIVTGPGCYAFGNPTDEQKAALKIAYRIADELRALGHVTSSGSAPSDDLLADEWDEPFLSDAAPVAVAYVLNALPETLAEMERRYGQEHDVTVHDGVDRAVNDPSPIAYITVGVPGSGKTTWRDHERVFLAKEGRDLSVISSDDMIEAEALRTGETYDQAFARADFRWINRELSRQLNSAIANNESLVIDRTNLSAKARRKYLDIIPDHYRKIAVVSRANRSTVDARLASRAGKSIPTVALDRMFADFEEPTRDEGFDHVINAVDLHLYDAVA